MESVVLETPAASAASSTARYAKCIETSKRVRWDIDRDVIRGREFDFGRKFMPDGLSKVRGLPFLAPAQARFFSQVQGRTYANMFALVERYIGAKTIELSKSHALGDQVALEALIRFADEELKHQRLFRKLEGMAAKGMPDGYRFVPDPNEVADVLQLHRRDLRRAVHHEREHRFAQQPILPDRAERVVVPVLQLRIRLPAVGKPQLAAVESHRHVPVETVGICAGVLLERERWMRVRHARRFHLRRSRRR